MKGVPGMKIAICGLGCDENLSEKIITACNRHYRTAHIKKEFDSYCDVVFAVGIDAVRQIRQIDEQIPVVLLCDSEEEALEGYGFHIDSCIKSPYSVKSIETALFV